MSVLELTRALVERASVTPEDAGCQDLIAARLEPLGFRIERMRFGEVDNLWARRGSEGPVFCFAGHTDVVPPGPRSSWASEPFVTREAEGFLYGRGTADMKASLAAMVVAVERVLAEGEVRGSIALLLTSDEEGPGRDGTRKVIETLTARGERIDWCVVGEPSSAGELGDVVRVGRRGSLNADLRVRGVAGHVAYPELVRNPIHALLPVLAELAGTTWDTGNEHFPPTSFQVSNLHAGEGVENVVPGEVTAKFNFRYSTEHSVESLTAAVLGALDRAGLDYSIEWRDSGRPFLTPGGPLVDAVSAAITEARGAAPELSTGGGTSDGRFIAPSGAAVVELGPVNATIHKPNERVRIDALEPLAEIYASIVRRLLRPSA